MEPRGKSRNADHLPLDQDGVVQFADRLFRLVEIEQHPRLGVNRSLRRIQIFGSSLLISRKSAPSEGDDAPGLVGDGKRDPVAKLGVHGCGCWLLAAGFWLLPLTIVIPSGVEGPVVLLRADG